MYKYLLGISFCLIISASSAQSTGRDTNQINVVWSNISTQFENLPNDSLKNLIIQEVNARCGEDYSCRFNTYKSVMLKLERAFNLPLAVEIGHEIIGLAQHHKQLLDEADTHQNLTRYHHALGNGFQKAVHNEKAIVLFEKIGEVPKVEHIRFTLLEDNLNSNNADVVLPQMYALLDNAVARADTLKTNFFRRRLIWSLLELRKFNDAMRLIEALEQMPVSSPYTVLDYGNWMIATLGRAVVTFERNDLDSAKVLFEKLVELAVATPDVWQEANALLWLVELEFSRNNDQDALAYLDRAQELAEAYTLNDKLIKIYKLRSEFAEANGRYAESLEYLKKQRLIETQWDRKKSDLDAQNHYLSMERDRATLAKTNTELELGLRKAQLRNSIVIVSLILLLSTLLFAGWFVQRKRKRKLAAQNLIISKQAEELISLDAAKSRFFANVSHELRTPLTLIQGPIQKVLKDGALDEQQTRLLRMVDHNTHQLKELVGDILDLQKVETSKMKVLLRPVALNPFFKTLASQFESLAKQKQIEFSFESTIEEKIVGLIDTTKCRQILNNLLSNAFKFTPSGEHVQVQLSLDGKAFQLRVSDTGPGIAEIDLPHVFDRFFQTNLPNKPAEGGTGIGLALCQEYARLFGGNISVKSIPGERTTFTVNWPVEISEESPERMHEAIALDSFEPAILLNGSENADLPTILVAEDNPELQQYISLLLSDRYNVQSANNGREALDHIASGTRVDLVLSDLMMPVMDGYQLLNALKTNDKTSGIPVVMLTARAEARDKLKALRIGVDDYLNKPFDEEELLARIENLLQHKAARHVEMAEAPTPEKETATPDQEWLEKFEAYVQAHLTDDALKIPDLAIEFAMSESTLLRQLKKCTGLTPSQYLKEARLDHARKLLEQNGSLTIAAIASAAGYGDTRSFSRSFKKRFGKLPTEFNSTISY